MLISIAQLAGGFILLVWGADRLVAGASALARNLGVSPLIIGLTIIAFGTSAPELVVSAVAASRGNPSLAVGNAIGSNIANIGLILGLTALFYPLRVESETLRREYPVLILIMVGSFIMAADLLFGRTEGWLLLTGLVALLIWMVRFGLRRGTDDPLAAEFEAEIPKDMPTGYAVFWMVIGLIVLPVSSKFLVDGAIFIARALEVSEAVIGLTSGRPYQRAAQRGRPGDRQRDRVQHVQHTRGTGRGRRDQSGRSRVTDAEAGLSGYVPVHGPAVFHGIRHRRAGADQPQVGRVAADPVRGLPGARMDYRHPGHPRNAAVTPRCCNTRAPALKWGLSALLRP
jgi:hypothetical protein